MALSEYTCVRKLCLAPRHSGRDAFSRAIIFLLRSVTKYYSLTLKITASVLHGLRKCVRELMVSDNRWLTLLLLFQTIHSNIHIHVCMRVLKRVVCAPSEVDLASPVALHVGALRVGAAAT